MIRTITCLLVLGLGSTAFGGVVYFDTVTGDADSGISSSNDYTLAIDFGNGAPVTVNGVAFTQVTGLATQPSGFDYQVNSGTYNSHGGNTNYSLSGAVAGLFQDMIYNGGCADGGIATITLSDLTPGQTYKTRIYTRQWDFGTWTGYGGMKRLSNVTFDGDGGPLTLSLYEDDMTMLGRTAPGTATAVNYVFTADASGTATIQFEEVLANASWHVYGLTNERVPASALTDAPQMSPTIANGSFETDTFTVYPGYCSGNRAITGWYTNVASRAGINPANGSPFANNGTIPDGSQVAFLQNGDATLKTSLSQPLYGFRSNEKYIVSFRENYRTGYTVPNLELSLGGQTIVQSHALVGGGYRYVASDIFSADATQQTLAFTNTTDGTADATAVIDQVEITRIYKLYGDNFNVNANTYVLDANPSNDAPDRFSGLLIENNGWTPDYLEAGAGDNLQQLGHDPRLGTLFFATRNASGYTNVYVSPNHSFVDYVVPGEKTQYVLQFKTEPLAEMANGDPVTSRLDDWTCVNFGVTSDKLNMGPNANNGVGVLFRGNGGWQIFDGTSGSIITVASGAGPIATDAEGYYDVRIAYEVDDFSGAAPVDVAVFVGEELIYSFTTAAGFTENYITLGAYAPTTSTTYTYSYFEDLELWTTAVPEPSSVVLVLLGLGMLIGWRCRK